MIMQISVRADVKKMTRDLTKVQKKIVPKVTSQALNKTGKQVRTQAVRQVSAMAGIRQKLVRSRLRFQSFSKPTRLRLIISAWFMPILAFKVGNARETSTGVKVGKRSFGNAFIATMPSGHIGVFARIGKPRLPIKEESINLNPGAEGVMVSIVNGFALTAFKKEFSRLLAVRLKRKG